MTERGYLSKAVVITAGPPGQGNGSVLNPHFIFAATTCYTCNGLIEFGKKLLRVLNQKRPGGFRREVLLFSVPPHASHHTASRVSNNRVI